MNLDLILKSGALFGGKTPQQILAGAKVLISDHSTWCQYAMARNSFDYPVKPTAEDACQWCLLGAVACVCPFGIIPPVILSYLDNLAKEWEENPNDDDPDYPNNSSYFNDNTDHDTLLMFLDEAIAQCP